ncbi:MAG: dihydropteroate synthase, partial [Lactobacillus iners]|nr:dihydropteroate synthase [Lactobacillus iners]MCT7808645.1 dihydropteroate synthase [Lactobacillus iners]
MEIKEIKYDKINIEGLPLQIIKRDILQRQEIVLAWQGIECVENKIIDFLNHFDIPL